MEMEKRLKWNAIGYERKTEILRYAITTDQKNLPPDHLKEYKKLQQFLDELNHLLDKMHKIQTILIPKLEKKFRVSFPTPELLLLALSRPSVRNIYIQVKKHFEKQSNHPFKLEEYDELASSGEAANVLALIGDSALDLAIIQVLWDSSLATVGELTTKRREIVSNEYLAKVCDQWDLDDFRISRLYEPTAKDAKEKTIEHEKATLVEAIFGVIYLEFGFQNLVRILPQVQYP